MTDEQAQESRTQAQADKLKPPRGRMAIGPVLFILAVLALLAAAVATGIGEPKGKTIDEADRTKVLALIGAGENLKFGMDRIVLEKGIAASDIDMNVSDTAAPNQLFSPTGGGLAPPSPGMANNPRVDKWLFPKGTVAGMVIGDDKVVLAVLPISGIVCAEINKKASGAAFLPAAAALGDFAASPAVVSAMPGDWPEQLVSSTMGCVQNSSVKVDADAGPTSPYFFYRLLAIE